MIKEALSKVVAKQSLTFDEAKQAIDEIMSGEVSPVVISSFLTALAVKGETDEEIAGAADGMRSKATVLEHDSSVLDIVGTGGDKSNTFNISTTAAFVIAAEGTKIAKHGNRAASSKSGAADCLEALGVNINAEVEKMQQLLENDDICFMFAQKYHSAMRFVGPVRKDLGIRTIFNVLGPLTNPARADMMVLGVFSEEFVEKIANALVKLGVKNALVVYGM
ncbi:MAG: anthranilate phosphoribosyltransferase, partial [Eubacterium sp.]